MAKYLKLLIVALFATMSFTLTSCGDDEDEPNGNVNIVGTWENVTGWDEAFGLKQYIRFQADGKLYEVDVYPNGVVEILQGIWSKDGNKITVSGDTEGTVTISNQTSTTMTLTTLGIPVSYEKVSDSVLDKYLDGESNENENGQYSFKFNNKTYYYGYDYYFANLFKIYNVGSFNMQNDYCLLLATAQDIAIKYDKETGLVNSEQGANSSFDATFDGEPFNPETAKKGDVLTFHRAISSSGDKYNYLVFKRNEWDKSMIYTLKTEGYGTLKFVSYDKEDEILTLEFINVKFDLQEPYIDPSDYPSLSSQGVINGIIKFHKF